MTQTKAQNKSPKTDPKEMEVYELFDKELKITVIKLFIMLKNLIYEQNENLNTEIENIKKAPNKSWD